MARFISAFKATLKLSTGKPSQCWLWQGNLDALGYGIGAYKRSARAHRSAWLYLCGPIPAGLEIDHTCRTRACVNPAHMELVTHAENIKRAVAHLPPCPHGAERVRLCKICQRQAVERYRANNPNWRERQNEASQRSYNKTLKKQPEVSD